MKKTILPVLLCFCITFINGQTKTYWHIISESGAGKEKDLWANKFKPANYKLLQLDEAALKTELIAAPLEKNIAAVNSDKIISVPNAEGEIEQFSVVESPVMEPGLAAKYPSIKTYIGQGIDNPGSVIRFVMSPSGFNATVSSVNQPGYYINLLEKTSSTYAVNARNEKDPVMSFKCKLDETSLNAVSATGMEDKTTLKGNADDGKLRKFRLALSVNGEYAQFFLNGSEADTAAMKAKVMDNLVACLLRANQVYERDFGIRMVYVERQDTLIFINAATDPYSSSYTEWSNQLQNTCTSYIGEDNYDIGHALIKVGSVMDNYGSAGCVGCVCKNAVKGSGYSSYDNPGLLNYMVIDYWTHEMAHQFGSTHSFTFSSEPGSQSQIEPGSGSTIMGYAGITGSTDVQKHSDDLFSTVNISQNTSYIKSDTGGAACAVVIETGNNTPVADAGADYIIPKSTPFVLTGACADADASDVLSCVWEQVDLGTEFKTFPKTRYNTGPAFRTFNYTNSPLRYFPNLTTILSGLLFNKWEALPEVARKLNFRYTVRDNHTGGGNNNSDDMVVTVDENSGPFTVTAQNGLNASEWLTGTSETITWNVAKTNKAPVNCSNVNILLSTDGGNTFTIVLVTNTPNDGEAEITVPVVNTDNARIKIEAVNNIFFDISNADFKITSVLLPVKWLSFTAQKLNNYSVAINWSTTNELQNSHYELERSADAINFNKIATVNAGNAPSKIQEYNFTDYKATAGANYYRIKQVDADGKSSYSVIAKVIIQSDAFTWSVLPNPAKDATVFLTRKALSNAVIILSNAAGKEVYRIKNPVISAGQQIIIPLNNLSAGMYILTVKSNENIQSQKIIVQ